MTKKKLRLEFIEKIINIVGFFPKCYRKTLRIGRGYYVSQIAGVAYRIGTKSRSVAYTQVFAIIIQYKSHHTQIAGAAYRIVLKSGCGLYTS